MSRAFGVVAAGPFSANGAPLTRGDKERLNCGRVDVFRGAHASPRAISGVSQEIPVRAEYSEPRCGNVPLRRTSEHHTWDSPRRICSPKLPSSRTAERVAWINEKHSKQSRKTMQTATSFSVRKEPLV